MHTVRADRRNVTYFVEGEADRAPVILVHALGASSAMWQPYARRLKDRYRVLTYDLAGHGNGDLWSGAAGTIDDYVDEVFAVCDAQRLERLSIVGLSLGGMIAAAAAAAQPARVRSLIVVAAAKRIGTPEVWDARIELVTRNGVEPLVAPTMQRWFGERSRTERPDVVRAFAEDFRRTSPAGYVLASSVLRDLDLSERLGRVRARTLFVGGGDDVAVPPSAIGETASFVSDAERVIVSNAAHMVSADQPERFHREVDKFLPVS